MPQVLYAVAEVSCWPCFCCSYGNVKQQAYKPENESRAFDDWCKRNAVSSLVRLCITPFTTV